MTLEDQIRATVQQVLNNPTSLEEPGDTGTPALPAAPEPLTLNINGNTLTFKDTRELEEQLTAFSRELQTTLKAPPAPNPPQIQGGRVSDDSNGNIFDKEEYVRLMNDDPRKAQNYVLSHTLFEGKVEDASAALQEFIGRSVQQGRQLAAFQFRDMHGEIPFDDNRVTSVIEQTRNALNLPFTPEGLEAAYFYAVQKNQLPNYQAIRQAQQNQQDPNAAPPYGQPLPDPYRAQTGGTQTPPGYQYPNPAAIPTGYQQGIPSFGRATTSPAPGAEIDYDSLSEAQLKQVLTSLGQLGIK